MKFLKPKLFLCLITILAVTLNMLSNPVNAEDGLSEEAQAEVNAGLDAIASENWSLAVERLAKSIDIVFDDLSIDFCEILNDCGDRYQKFVDTVPSYVISNLALASDKYGQAPLTAAMYYRAHLAYDPETSKRREIEKRIKELEKKHIQYAYPFCDAAEARMALIGSILTAYDGNIIAANCIAALVAIDQTSRAKEIEKRYRKGYFKKYMNSCGDLAFFDLGYAVGYRLVGQESKAISHAARVNDLNNKPKGSCGNMVEVRIDELKKKSEYIEGERNEFQSALENKEWKGGKAAHALSWIHQTSWAHDIYNSWMMGSDRTCDSLKSSDGIPSPLLDLAGYLAVRDYDPIRKVHVNNIADSNRYSSVIAAHNTCAAYWIARYWVRYDRNVQLWEKRNR